MEETTAPSPPASSGSTTTTVLWTEDEKTQVLEILKHGRVSPMTIVARLGHTKTLGQVAEFLDYMEFWSAALDTPESRHERLQSASMEVSEPRKRDDIMYKEEEQGDDENSRIKVPEQLHHGDPELLATNATTGDGSEEEQEEEHREITAPMPLPRRDLIDIRYLYFLGFLISGCRLVATERITEMLKSHLKTLLQKVISDAIVRSKIATTSGNRHGIGTNGISRETVMLSLEACGWRTEEKTAHQTFNDLLDKYVDLSSVDPENAQASGDDDDDDDDDEGTQIHNEDQQDPSEEDDGSCSSSSETLAHQLGLSFSGDSDSDSESSVSSLPEAETSRRRRKKKPPPLPSEPPFIIYDEPTYSRHCFNTPDSSDNEESGKKRKRGSDDEDEDVDG
ncbi:hypothetical protein IWW48_002970 [Coemansia sp. RSA 1200]|nr:hypothetical protein IWW48_002970 [Coemansia sp. RSA 1200]